jgi:hypothetical protein
MRPSIIIISSIAAGVVAINDCAAQTAGADGADSVRKQQSEHTLSSLIRVRAAHIAFGAGSVPYLNKESGGSAAEFRLGISLKSLPDWTFTWASNAVMDQDTTSYVAPRSDGYHPLLTSVTQSLEVQRRWRNASVIHPLATAAIGTLTTAYGYYEYPRSGGSIRHQDEKTNSTFYSLAGGGELNIARWMRTTLTLGYRSAAVLKLPAGTSPNSGFMVTSLVEFGRF